MNSDKAAAVRDAINGCPEIVDPEADLRERDGDPHETKMGGPERTITGDHLKPDKSSFRPAYVEQSGTLSNDEGTDRPVFVVILEPLWHQTDDVRSLSPELVYEVAKHDCRIRFYPPEHRLGGAIWICDHFRQQITDANGDRCPDCESTYWKLRDGEPECARCGCTIEPEPTIEA